VQSPQYPSTPLQAKDRKRKQSQEAPVQKRLRTSRPDSAVEHENEIDPIDHWRREGTWPKEYFERDDQTREYFNRDLEEESWLREYWLPNMERLSSLRGKQSTLTSNPITPSDRKPREEKSAPYSNPFYETVLKTKGSYMDKSDLDVTGASKSICRSLLESEQTIPQDSLFRDDLFENTCQMIRNKNETRVIRDISLLIVPSAEILAIRGAKHLEILIESVNERWNNSIPVTASRPQPDYSVGFKREAFTDQQFNKLQPFIGGFTDTSFFMATNCLYFPFLTCEVKCGAASLDVADRQNAHSMTIAVRGIVEFFKLAKREKELHREILAFSISHDHAAVRIYGHYPVIDGNKTTFYRHTIRRFDFTELDGKEKWSAYKFTKNLYDVWMPTHFKRLCSVIDELPRDPNFSVSPLSGGTRLSQVFESYHLSRLNPDSASVLQKDDSQASLPGSQDATPNTSLSQPRPSKKPRKRLAED
jgi:hypothetical protein